MTAIFCGPRARRRQCSCPGCHHEGARECDHPVKRPAGKSQTCDRLLCEAHAVRQKQTGPTGEKLEFCPPHDKRAREAAGP